jgi:DNA polymerase III subunit gamma/tau
LHLTLEIYKALQTSLQPRLHLELGLLKLVQAGRLQSIEQAIAQLGGPGAPIANARNATPAIAKTETAGPAAAAPVRSGDIRENLHDALAKAGKSFSADAIQRSEVSLEGGELVIRAPRAMMLAVKDAAVQQAASQVVGKPVKVRVEIGEALTAPPASSAVAGTSTDTELRERALSHPGVKRFQELFPGAQVRTVRNLNE